jgi:DNA-binding winged helix-turn-helix (wHTH) protein
MTKDIGVGAAAWRYDSGSGVLADGGHRAQFTRGEEAFAVVLIRAAGRCVAYQVIANRLWPERDFAAAMSSMGVAAHRIRRKLRAGFFLPALETVHGCGFLWSAPTDIIGAPLPLRSRDKPAAAELAPAPDDDAEPQQAAVVTRDPLRAGDPVTWRAITAGTALDGVPYRQCNPLPHRISII